MDGAGNTSVPLALAIRTADVTPPVWAEGCELTADLAESGNFDAGIVFTWCEATDNDRLDHFELRRGGAATAGDNAPDRYGIRGAVVEPATIPADQLTHTLTQRPLDGTYVIAACDPTGNCSERPSVYVDVEMRARMATVRAELSSSLMLALIGTTGDSLGSLFDSGDMWADNDLSADVFADMEGLGGVGVASGGEGYGGLGVAGWGGSGGAGGGGGVAAGIGGLGTRGSSTYKPPSASLKPGGQSDLAAHVDKRLSRIEHCYKQARAEASDLKGTLTIRLTADAEGSITVDGVSGPDEGGLTPCVTGAVRGRLAEPPGEAVSGTFSVTLEPGSV